MERKRDFLVLAAIAVFATVFTGTAVAAQRTFVASYGLDTNPCSLTAPCRAFGAAIAQTDADGEVIVLDSAGYGSVTITKGVTITSPPGVYAGISVFSGQNGVTVNAGGTDTVILRGLLISDQGGLDGIRINSGRRVYVENCAINGTNNGISALFVGVTSLYVRGVTVRNANNGLQAYGQSAFAAASRVYVARSTFDGNGDGIVIGDIKRTSISDSTIAGRGIGFGVNYVSDALQSVNPSLSIDRSEIVGHDVGIRVAGLGGGAPTSVVHVSSSVVSNNVSAGLSIEDQGYLRLMGSQVTGNSPGISLSGNGVIASLGNNMVAGNGGSPPAATPIAPY